MSDVTQQRGREARIAIQNRDWLRVRSLSNAILEDVPQSAEGHFLIGMAEKASGKLKEAVTFFEKALELDINRYDAAIELASLYSIARKNSDAFKLLEKYKVSLSNSSLYSDLAGTVYTEIGLAEYAYPLFKQAVALQPNIDLFNANLASCSVYVGEIDNAERIYKNLLEKNPTHQRNHYYLSRLRKAEDYTHIDEMLSVLEKSNKKPEENVFLYYAIAKEYEDLGKWSEAFQFYKKGGDAVNKVSKYDLGEDIEIIDAVIENCTKNWVDEISEETTFDKEPIFIVGLPRTGSTLCERIISNHSKVSTLGETLFFQMTLRKNSGIESYKAITPEMLTALLDVDPRKIAKDYIEQVDYRLGKEEYFVDKLPLNILYLGYFAKAFPKARIVYLDRNPMDACFAMYKQIFTWAYKYSYSIDDLGKYYVAFNRLIEHWERTLGNRFIRVSYEDLVSDIESEVKRMLETLGLPFEDSCLDFENNKAPSATASSVQVREKTHKKSVGKWKKFEAELKPLKQYFENVGIIR